MSCVNCGADVPEGAGFCPACGSRQPVLEGDPTLVMGERSTVEDGSRTHAVGASPLEHVDERRDGEAGSEAPAVPEPDLSSVPEPDLSSEREPDLAPEPEPEPEPEPDPDSGVAPPDPEPVPEPALGRVRQAVAAERDLVATFLDAGLPLLRAPLVVFTATAVAVALVASLAAGLLVQLVALLAGGGELDDLDGLGDWWELAWSGHFSAHQVPYASEGLVLAAAPLVLVVLPILTMWLGLHVAARRERSPGLSPTTAVAVGASYGLSNLVLGALGPDDFGVAWFRCLLFSMLIAAAAWGWARRQQLHSDATQVPPGVQRDSRLARSGEFFVRPAAIFVGMLLVASVLTLVANIVDTATSDDRDGRGARVATDLLHIVDQGWYTLGHGMLAATRTSSDGRREFRPPGEEPEGGNDNDDNSRSTATRAWELRDESADTSGQVYRLSPHVGDLEAVAFALVLVAAFGTVLLGGLYSGFRMARSSSGRRRPREAALVGALAGPLWAVLSLVLSLVVTDRMEVEQAGAELDISLLSAADAFFMALLVGAALGALGGLLASRTAQPPSARADT